MMAKIIRRAIPIGAFDEFIPPPPPGFGFFVLFSLKPLDDTTGEVIVI